MKRIFYLCSIFSFLMLLGCDKDDDNLQEDFVVAFKNPSLSFETNEKAKDITLVFSVPAPQPGSISLNYTATNAQYGDNEDFITLPNMVENEVIVDFNEGDEMASFTFKKLKEAFEGSEKSISFNIKSISIPNSFSSGNTSTQVTFTETAALGGTSEPNLGGPTQPNQVYMDLSSQKQYSVSREAWDLGFYSGDDFRVIINGSLYMAVAALEETDIDAITATDVSDLKPQVAVGTFNAANMEFVDGPTGDLSATAIDEISSEDTENKVYLVNLGYKIGDTAPETGTVAIAGDPRGWMKIRILKAEDGYTLQYAKLDDTTHKEVNITKDATYNFQYFSLLEEKEVMITPQKDKWDLNFTVFTNEIEGFGSYGYADFVVTNRLDNVESYKVTTATKAYDDFNAGDVETSAFKSERNTIGSSWRRGGGPNTLPSLKEEVYYIVKDTDGNLYKLRFTSLLDEDGVRGYPSFEYTLLNE